mmetsp:Transcript_679/g.1447  ORF Transcript_679/g.1447 Transcript_679/m.1447 type:complete len:262 (+) Transcript_679:244-1029(+)
MWRKWRRFLCVLIHIWHGLRENLSVPIGTGSVTIFRLCSGCLFLISYESIFSCRFFLFEFTVTCVRLEIGNIYKVIDSSLDIGNCWLIGSESPFVINDEFKRMLPSFQVVNIGKVVTRSMHWNLTRPPVESSCDIDLPTAMLPSKDRRYGIVVQPVFNSYIPYFYCCISICVSSTCHRCVTIRSDQRLLLLLMLSPYARSSSCSPCSGRWITSIAAIVYRIRAAAASVIRTVPSRFVARIVTVVAARHSAVRWLVAHSERI